VVFSYLCVYEITKPFILKTYQHFRLWVIATILLCSSFVQAQVEQVNYELRYNPDSSYFDFYLHILAGSATSVPDRTQFNSQISIVSPSETKFSIVSNYFPLIDNRNYQGVSGDLWKLRTSHIYNQDKKVDIINCDLSPTSQYNNLIVGDTVKLFSIKVDSIFGCISDIRLWDNNLDSPDPLIDFNQGFTIGGPQQLYAGNIQTNHPPIAGQDETLCGGASHQMIAVGTSNGAWSVVSPLNNSATVSNPSPGIGVLNIQSNASGVINLLFRDSIDYDFKCITIDKPQITIEVDSLPCATTRTITAMGGVSYSWTTGNTTDRQIVNQAGTYTVTVTNSNRCTATATIAVNIPSIDSLYFDSQNHICIGNTIIVSNVPPFGTWQSSNPAVATVNLGIINGVSAGTAMISYIYPTGCPAPNTLTVTVNPRPTVISSNSSICVGGTTTLSPSVGGSWSSSNVFIATVSNTGLVTGISPGTVTIVFKQTTTGCSSIPLPISVSPRPVVAFAGLNKICIGSTTNLIPSIGGIWENLNPEICSITSNGTVTGIASGIANARFVMPISGCISDILSIEVLPKPLVNIIGNDTICAFSTTQLTPINGGTWQSKNPQIAIISNYGLVTGISEGEVRFAWTDASSGCTSEESEPIKVLPQPIIAASSQNICLGQTLTLSPISGGVWENLNQDIVTISNNIVTAIKSGKAKLKFTENTHNCSNSIEITVASMPLVSFTGSDSICIGSLSSLSPGSSGAWSSSNDAVATVSNNGTITAISSGAATFTYTQTSTGCSSLPTAPLTVLPRPIINLQSTELEVGKLANLIANTNVTWYSSNDKIVKIIQNKWMSGINTGSCTIYAINAYGCKSLEVIITVTDPKFTLVGYAFRDANSNGLFDSTIDSPLPNCAIHIPALNGIYFTDNTGFYNIQVLPGNYDVYFSISFGNWLSDSISFNIEIDKNVEYLFAAFVPLAQEPNSLISIHPSSLLCNTIADLDVSVFNNSSQKQSGYIALKVDEKTFAMNTVPFPIGTQGDYLIWEYLDILPGFSQTIKVGLDIPTPVSALDSMTFHAVSLSQAGDTLSQFYFHDTISCDVIDNNIRSWPDREGLANPTLRGESLNYHIKFENPNNETVNKVEIKNILDKHIDQSSILIKSSSHPVRSYVEDGYLYFVMDSIELVNRVLTPVKTGYVTFECTFDPMAADGTVIKNKAEITFNDNVNFSTNETINTIVSALPCTSIDLMETICPQNPLVTSQNVYDKEGFYVEVIKNDICDTIKTYRISLVAAPDGTLTAIDDKITAVEGSAKYNWYECGTNTILYSGTENIFTPSKSGQYYAIIQGVSCETKTDCITISVSSTTDLLEDQIKIFPNPTSNTITISSPYLVLNTKLLNTFGQEILVNTNGNMEIGMLPDGVYILEIFTDKGKICKSIIKH
jgi:hypothetical protein